MISTPCKMFPRQISSRIFVKMSFFSLHVQNPFFRQTLMILKIDTRLGSEIKSLSTEGGTVNSCTALTPSRQWHHAQHYCIDQPMTERGDPTGYMNSHPVELVHIALPNSQKNHTTFRIK